MPAFTAFFRPLAPRSGVQLVAGLAAIGTGGVAALATGTASVHVGLVRRKCKLISLNYIALTAAAGSSTITITAIRRIAGTVPANSAQTAAQDITATAITTLDKAYNVPITASDANSIFQVGDTLRVDIIAAGTVTTQPQGVLVAEWAVLG